MTSQFRLTEPAVRDIFELSVVIEICLLSLPILMIEIAENAIAEIYKNVRI